MQHLASLNPLSAQNPLFAIAFWLALAISVLPVWIARLASIVGAVKRSREPRDQAAPQDRSWLALIGLTLGIVFLKRYWLRSHLPDGTIPGDPALLFSLGIALMLLGSALYWYSRSVLGRRFSRRGMAQAGEPLIERGPYRYIRHPAFSGRLITIFGIGLSTTNWAALLAIMLCALVVMTFKATWEERTLRRAIGDSYVAYTHRTRRFIPFVY